MPTTKMSCIVLFVCSLALVLGGSTVQAQPLPQDPRSALSPSASPRRDASNGGPIANGFPISLVSNAVGHMPENHQAVAYGSHYQEYLTAWNQNTSGGENYIYAQLVSRDGRLLGSRVLIPGFVGTNSAPDVAYNPARGEYLVVFEFQGGGSYGIYGQRVDLNGTSLGTAIPFASSTTYQFRDPTVAFETDTGQYLVAWQKRQGFDSSGIEARALSGDGATLSSVIEITGMMTSVWPERPDVACTRTLDECLVVWDRWYDSGLTDYEVHGQRIHMAGDAHQEGPLIQILYSSADEVDPSVAAIARPTGIGQYLVASAYRSAGVWSSVGRLMTDAGALEPGGWLLLGDSNGIPPAVAGNENMQEYLVAWPTAAGTAMQARTVSTVGGMGAVVQARLSTYAPMYAAIASGPFADYIVVFQDNYAGYPIDVFGFLWGTRNYLPLLKRD